MEKTDRSRRGNDRYRVDVKSTRQRLARPAMTSVDSHALIAAAASGWGVALLPDVMAREAAARGRVAWFSVKGMRLRNENRILLHADKYFTDAMRRFMACATQAMRHREADEPKSGVPTAKPPPR